MAQIVHLERGVSWPIAGDREPWLRIEAFDSDGKYYGSGWAEKPDGSGVFYASLPENDASLEAALSAATEWADKYRVPIIHVRTEPQRA